MGTIRQEKNVDFIEGYDPNKNCQSLAMRVAGGGVWAGDNLELADEIGWLVARGIALFREQDYGRGNEQP